MKPRVLILILCLAGLVTFVWPPEVMSPASERGEVAMGDRGPAGGRTMDLSQIDLLADVALDVPGVARLSKALPIVEEPAVGAIAFAASESQAGSLRGIGHDSLVRQGEILAHEPELMGEYLASRDLHPGRERFLQACAYLALEQVDASKGVWKTVAANDPVSSAERALVGLLLAGEGGSIGPVPASAAGKTALVRGLEIASLRGELRRILRARDYAAACAVLSNLLEMELMADWDPHMEALVSWAKQLNAAQGFHRWSAKGEWPSVEVVVQPGDSLVKIRKRVIRDRPELNICTGLIARANQLPDANSIRPGQVLRVPLEPVRTVVDLSARFLLYYHGDEVVCAWPVGIGRDGLTLPGEYTVKDKGKEPAWFYPGDFVPKDERERSEGYLPYGHPENPLGTRWMGWKGSQGLAFHGTWEPETIGTAASKGCIRLSNRDVEELFEILPVGTTIQVHP